MKVHCVPRGDLIEHDEDEDCICGPRSTLHQTPTGDAWVFVHHSLDRRELSEGRS